MRRPVLVLLLLALVAAGCGRDRTNTIDKPQIGIKGTETQAAQGLGFPVIATKNTTRVAGADPVADAAAVAQAVYPSRGPGTNPAAVTLVDRHDWRAGIAASALMARPIRAPVLLSDGKALPPATQSALETLAPKGSKAAGGAQIVRVGEVAQPPGLRTTDIKGRNPFALAKAIDAFVSAARGSTSRRVLVVSADRPAYAMPAAAYAAKSGDPVLFVRRDTVPAETRAAIAAHGRPHIYVLGPSKIISPKVTQLLRPLGTVTRLGGADPVENAVEFARYADGSFGWGVVDPGHGLVFAGAAADPQTAPAAAALSASGTYGPLLLVGDPEQLDQPLIQYLLDIQPGYTKDPVRGVYNHGWIIGDEQAVSIDAQSQIDRLLEIAPVVSARP